MADQRRDAAQTAYRILLGMDSSALLKGIADWDTAWQRSSASLVTYNGKPLKPFTKYYWCIAIADQQQQKTRLRFRLTS